jgi:cytochrome c553
MTKITLLSLIAASVLFTACGEDTNKAADEATVKTAEVAKETTADMKKAATDLVEATKAKAAELAEQAKKEADALAEKAKVEVAKASEEAQKVADDLKEKAVETTEAAKAKAVQVLSDDSAGETAYAKCAGCHGKDGKTKALGKSEIIAGQSSADIEAKLTEYKAGTRNVTGMGTLMKGQVASMGDADIKAVSAYISAM